jgi:hypothetical protein
MATTFAVPDGRVAMAATLWPGTNATNSISNAVNTVSFQPDFVWLKDRTQAQYHTLYDSVRGSGSARSLILPLTDAEGGQSNLYGYLSSFNSNGFTLTPGSTSSAWVNASGDNYVGWQWKAGGTAVSNTAGTITSSVSANTTAGFSVVTYTGTGANATVGHGLGVAPSMVIVKHRNAADAWYVYHVSLTSAAYVLQLNTTIAQTSIPTIFNSTAPTNSVFSVGTDSSTNTGSGTYVAYCWAPVAGYSAFGSYTGNGSADGPFIYTGFRPRFLMIKSSSGAFNWFIEDSSRNTTNVTGLDLSPNLSDAEANNSPTFDFLSNGFKLRNTYTSQNGSGTTYIYAAYAENPLKYANAR